MIPLGAICDATSNWGIIHPIKIFSLIFKYKAQMASPT